MIITEVMKLDRHNKIGQTIKFFRQLHHMNQDTLAVGICTTSYLSRIENGLVEPNEIVYQLLFQRLDLDFTSYFEKDSQQEQLIEQIYENLLSNETINEKELETLRLIYEQRTSPSLQIQVDLVYGRYLLSQECIEEAATILASLNDSLLPSDSREWQLFVATKTYYELLIGNYDAILNREFQSNSKFHLAKSSTFEQANYAYHLAFASHRAYQFSLAKQYIEEAIQLFKHRYKPLFQVKLYSMYGVILNALGQTDGALKEYHAAIELLEYVPTIATDNQWSSIYNNIAFTYESNKQFERAVHYYEKALAFKNDIHTRINYTRTLLFGEKKELFSKEIHELSKKQFSEGTHHHMQFLLMRAFEKIDTLESLDTFYKIEKTVFNYFSEAEHIELMLSYGPLVAKVHEEAKQYKRMGELYQILFETSEKMRQRISNGHHV